MTTQNLKPLNFKVHEAVSKGWIVIGVAGKTGGRSRSGWSSLLRPLRADAK